MKPSEKGSVALEYVLVTTFATVLAIAMLGVVTSLTKEQLRKMSEKVGLDMDTVEFDPFGTP